MPILVAETKGGALPQLWRAILADLRRMLCTSDVAGREAFVSGAPAAFQSLALHSPGV
jgi:hypothetical protein